MRLLTGSILALVLALPSLCRAGAPDPRTVRSWKAKCSGCHGADGKGQTDPGKKLGVSDMTSPAWQKKLTDDQLKAAITKGVKETRDGKQVEMPAIPGLRPDQLDALVKMMRGFAK